MPIKLSRELQVWWPVSVSLPQDGGLVEKHTVEFLLTVPRESARRKILNRYDGNAAALSASSAEQMTQELREFIFSHVADWRDILDDAGKPVEFSPQALGGVLEALPAMTPALAQALGEISLGKPATPGGDI